MNMTNIQRIVDEHIAGIVENTVTTVPPNPHLAVGNMIKLEDLNRINELVKASFNLLYHETEIDPNTEPTSNPNIS